MRIIEKQASSSLILLPLQPPKHRISNYIYPYEVGNLIAMSKQITQQNQEQQELISPELIQKFDGDKELVQQFMSEGYTTEQLTASTITHPTRYDPAVFLGDEYIGMWIDSPAEKKEHYSGLTYQNRRFS